VATAVSTAVRWVTSSAHVDRTLHWLRLPISSAVLAQTVRIRHARIRFRSDLRLLHMGSGANRLFTVDFDTFSKILNRPGGFREPFDIEEYIRGFQVFDKDRSGFVGKGQIKYILTNLGEKMSEEEVDELFKSTIDASNNEVDYRGKFLHL